MDTRQQSSEAAPADQEAMKAFVDAQLAYIKGHMPMTYKAIKDKAGEIGNRAYSYVRLGIAGKPNTFYAVEAKRAVGTPFVNLESADLLADMIKQFGGPFLILWCDEALKGDGDGTH